VTSLRSSIAPGRGSDGAEPDPRFTFANERTLLAWLRTALALIAAGLAAVQFVDIGPRIARDGVAAVVIAAAAVLAIVSGERWERNQLALRHGQPLPSSRLPRRLASAIAVLSAIATIAVAAKALS
jgi:putative membrane protein